MADLHLSESGWKEIFLLLLQFRKRFTVTGNSMLPVINPGDQLLINPRAYRFHPPIKGDLVVAVHPFRPDIRLVKQVRTVQNGSLYLEGTNLQESTDSRTLGSISKEKILGKVTSLFYTEKRSIN